MTTRKGKGRVVDLPDFGSAGNKNLGIIPQNSGFYNVRNNREIMESHTFDFYKKHPDFSHFRAELCFDGSLDRVFHTDIKKMSIHPPQGFLDRLRMDDEQRIPLLNFDHLVLYHEGVRIIIRNGLASGGARIGYSASFDNDGAGFDFGG